MDGFPGHDGKPVPQVAAHLRELDLLWLDLDSWGAGAGVPKVPGSFTNVELQAQCGQLQAFTKPSFAMGWLKRIKMKREQQIYNSMARKERETDWNVEAVNSNQKQVPAADKNAGSNLAGPPPEGRVCVISTVEQNPAATQETDIIASFVKKVMEEDTHGLVRAIVVYSPSEHTSAYYKLCFENHKLVTAVCGTWDGLLSSLGALRGSPPARERFAPQDSTGQKMNLQFCASGSARSKAPNSMLCGPDAGKLLVRCYDLAEGGCALPGNTYWLGRPNSTSGAALLAASTLGEHQNPFINPALCSTPPCILPTPHGL